MVEFRQKTREKDAFAKLLPPGYEVAYAVFDQLDTEDDNMTPEDLWRPEIFRTRRAAVRYGVEMDGEPRSRDESMEDFLDMRGYEITKLGLPTDLKYENGSAKVYMLSDKETHERLLFKTREEAEKVKRSTDDYKTYDIVELTVSKE